MNNADLAFSKAPLDQKAADALRRYILGGQMPQGERLTEQGLARRFDLSPGTVRSALGRLVAEGLVSRRPYAGWEVVRLSTDDLVELTILREALEGTAALYAAHAAAGGADTRPLHEAEARLEAACAAGDTTAVADADLDVHRCIVELTGNRRLIEHYRLIAQQTRLAIVASNEELADLEAIAAEHRVLVAAVVAGEAALAERLAREHTRDAAALLLQANPNEENA